MTRIVSGFFLSTALCVVSAYADELYISDGTNQCLVGSTGTLLTLAGTCGGAGSGDGTGTVGYSGLIGTALLSISGVTKTDLGSAALPVLDLNTSITAGAGSVFTIRLTDIGFTLDGNTSMNASGHNGSSSFAFTGFEDPTNTFCTVVACGGSEIGLLTGNGGLSGSPIPNSPGPYSLTLQEVLTFTGAASDGGTDSLTVTPAPVPEPSSLLLFGTVLVGAAVRVKRRLLS